MLNVRESMMRALLPRLLLVRGFRTSRFKYLFSIQAKHCLDVARRIFFRGYWSSQTSFLVLPLAFVF